MKAERIVCVLMALALLCAGALADWDALTDWTEKYNKIAVAENGEALNASLFERVDDGDGNCYYAYTFSEESGLMVSFDEGGDAYMCAVQTTPDDMNVRQVIACALAASDDGLTYDDAFSMAVDVTVRLTKAGASFMGTLNGWYYIAARMSEGENEYLMVGFTYVGETVEDSGIWNGLNPDEDEGGETPDSEAPAPSATVKPDKNTHKA